MSNRIFKSLSEIDYFMYARDRALTDRGRRGLVCALVLEFQSSDTQLRSILQKTTSNDLYLMLNNLRLNTGGFRSYWESINFTQIPDSIYDFEDRQEMDVFIQNIVIDLKHDSPFKVIAGRICDKLSVLVFVWSHVLLDAHGAERIIQQIIEEAPPKQLSYSHGKHHKFSLSEARFTKDFIFESAKGPITTFISDKSKNDAEYSIYRVKFDRVETDQIDNSCKRMGVELFSSLVYLAATARSVATFLETKGQEVYNFHVPVPHDICRKKSATAITNSLSFLFYRIEKPSMESLQKCVHHLLGQAENMVEKQLPLKSKSLFKALKYLPIILYNRTVLSPTKGHFASFCFSDTGNSLSRFKMIDGLVVEDAIHYPPHFLPPGFSVIFSRRLGCLSAIIVYSKGLISNLEVELFAQLLRNEFLETSINANT